MTRLDGRLIVALVVPLGVWPWIPAWEGYQIKAGQIAGILLFILIPLAEEALFRGLIQGCLLASLRFRRVIVGLSGANLLTSLAFAAAHLWQHNLVLVPGYFAVSLVLGYFRERYGGILVPVLLHSYYNLGLLVVGS